MIRAMEKDEAARARYESYCTRNGVAVMEWATLDAAFRKQWEPDEGTAARKPVGRAECVDDTFRKRA